MSNVGKPFVIGTKRGMVSLFSQFVRQVCTVTLAAFPEEPIGNGKMFRFTTHLHRLRYRACKRCKPNQVEFLSHSKAIAQACRAIELAEEKLDLAKLAASVGLSPSHFQRVFKAQVGLSQKQYAMALRK